MPSYYYFGYILQEYDSVEDDFFSLIPFYDKSCYYVQLYCKENHIHETLRLTEVVERNRNKNSTNTMCGKFYKKL